MCKKFVKSSVHSSVVSVLSEICFSSRLPESNDFVDYSGGVVVGQRGSMMLTKRDCLWWSLSGVGMCGICTILG